jgi:hypothetical protein
MLETFLKDCTRVVLPGESVTIPGAGAFIFVESASVAFELQPDDRRRVRAKAKFKMRFAPFTALNIFNTHATKTLKIIIWIGTGEVDYNEIFLPQTELIPHDITLANLATLDLPGVNSSQQVRKQITVTLGPSIPGRVELYNADTETIVAIISASSSGGGFCIETSQDLILRNKTGQALSSLVDTIDIAVASTWYIN